MHMKLYSEVNRCSLKEIDKDIFVHYTFPRPLRCYAILFQYRNLMTSQQDEIGLNLL